MRKAIVIGLTGQTGAGKTTVADGLRHFGYQVIKADEIARLVTEKGSPVLQELAAVFGKDILKEDGTLDRALLAERAFATPEETKLLNGVTHPEILRLINKKINGAFFDGYEGVILDASQLFPFELCHREHRHRGGPETPAPPARRTVRTAYRGRAVNRPRRRTVLSIRKHGCGCGCFHGILSLVLSLVVIAAVVLTVREAFYQYTYPVKYASYVEDASAELGVDPEARSEVGARGLMQVTEETFDWLRTKETFGNDNLKFEDLDKPDIAINYGTYFLKLLLEEFDGDVPTAMSAYHAGRGSVHSWLEQAKYSSNGETLDEIPKDDTAYYVQKIERAMGVYEKRLKEQAEENENVHRLRANFAKFVDAYVVPLLDNLFDKIGERFGNKLQALTFLVGAGR